MRHLASGFLAAGVLFAAATLTPAADAVPLFDGKSLDGWAPLGGKAKYSVEDGCIVGRAVPNTPNTFLCTTKNYGNFELEMDFKVSPGLNSGVQIRSEFVDEGKEVESAGATIKGPRVYGYQYEIDPSKRAFTGGIYDEARRKVFLQDLSKNEASQKAFKHNEWNHMKVVCNGDSIKTWINGVPASDITDNVTAKGFIGLQVHGVGMKTDPFEVRWKNIMIKELK